MCVCVRGREVTEWYGCMSHESEPLNGSSVVYSALECDAVKKSRPSICNTVGA